MKYILASLLFWVMPFFAEAAEGKTQNESQIYLSNRLPSSNRRYDSVSLVLELMQQRQAQVIVETGTARGGTTDFAGDGGSTVIFGHWARQNNAAMYSVDIDPRSVEKAKKATLPYAQNLQILCCDSIHFLENFNQPIDFLYLDSYDYDVNNPLPSQQHHLKEIKAAYSKLSQNSVVMVDDCDLPGGGKGNLVIPYLLARGWKILYKGYQVILIKDER